MEPLDYARALRRRLLALIALTVLGAFAGYGIGGLQPVKYEASSSVYVSAAPDATNQGLLQSNQYTQEVVQTYAQLATLPAVLGPVASTLGLDESSAALAKQVTATAQLNTVIVQITATSSSPNRAAQIADATAASLIARAEALAPKAKGKPTVELSVVAPAVAPRSPVGPGKTMFAIIGAVVGLLLGVVYAIGRSLLDTRITGQDELERVTDVPVLGAVSRERRGAGPVVKRAPQSVLSEEYRRVRTNLEFVDAETPARVVVVTSGLPGEGKSTTALNLALALAEQRDLRVLLVDGDLRRPSIADATGIIGGVGLTTVLLGTATAEQAIQQWGDTGLSILPSGAIPPNPSQLLGSAKMAALVDALRGDWDFVVIDAPPLLPVVDALTLAGLANGAVVVALSRKTRSADLGRSLESLELVGARVLGVVLNQAPRLKRSAYRGYVGGPGDSASRAHADSPATSPARAFQGPAENASSIAMSATRQTS